MRWLAAPLGVVWIALALGGCADRDPEREPVGRGELVYDGATTLSNRLWPIALPAFERRTGVRVRVERSGGGKGLKAMYAGQADVAGIARALTPRELAERPYVSIIGYDALGVWVNAGNGVKGLTRAQLADLFTGKITSWKQVGGKDLPVLPCTEHLLSERATLEAFRQLVLGGGRFGPVKELEDPSDCLAFVAATPGGVTPASTAYAIGGVRALAIEGVEPVVARVRDSTYPLTRPLLLVTRQRPTGALKELFDFLASNDGQTLVAQAGFIPAR